LTETWPNEKGWLKPSAASDDERAAEDDARGIGGECEEYDSDPEYVGERDGKDDYGGVDDDVYLLPP
jgi:hypothetical protein